MNEIIYSCKAASLNDDSVRQEVAIGVHDGIDDAACKSACGFIAEQGAAMKEQDIVRG